MYPRRVLPKFIDQESIRHPLKKCEKAVDLTAMLLGFSRIYELACHKELRAGNTINISVVGYLTQAEVADAVRFLAGQQSQGTGSSDDVTADKQAKAAAKKATKKATGSLATFLIGTAMFAALLGAIILGGPALGKLDLYLLLRTGVAGSTRVYSPPTVECWKNMPGPCRWN
jgi:hypothetical protein